jgi:hypothetical protein
VQNWQFDAFVRTFAYSLCSERLQQLSAALSSDQEQYLLWDQAVQWTYVRKAAHIHPLLANVTAAALARDVAQQPYGATQSWSRRCCCCCCTGTTGSPLAGKLPAGWWARRQVSAGQPGRLCAAGALWGCLQRHTSLQARAEQMDARTSMHALVCCHS